MTNTKLDKFRQIKNLAEENLQEYGKLSSEPEMKMDELLAGIRRMDAPRYMCLQREAGGIMFDAVDKSLGNMRKFYVAIDRISRLGSIS